MTIPEAINLIQNYIEETKNHSCYEDKEDEYGIYPCCNEPDYKGHKFNCTHNKIDEAINLISKRIV